MAKAFVTRALNRALSSLGEQSTLNGAPVGCVSLEYNVEVDAGLTGIASDNPIVSRTVATFEGAHPVAKGDVLIHPDGSFRIDAKVSKSPYRSQYVVLPL